MKFYKTKAAVPLGQGQTLGFKGGKGGGYYAKGKVQTDQQFVTSQVDAVMAPLIKDLQDRGKTTSTNLGGIYDALAQSQAQVAPAIQGTYQNATANTAAFSKGYSDALKAQLGDSAAQSNIILAQNGSPQQVQGGEGAADVLFGIGGSIPGQALAREGAAFTSAAQMLPGQARTLGAQEQAKTLGSTNAEIAKLEAEKPGLIQKALSELHAARASQQELELKTALAQQAFGLDVRQQEFNEAATGARITNDRERIKNERYRLALDKSRERFNQLVSLSGLEMDEKQYELAVQKEARMARQGKGKNGFTAKEIREFRAIAYDSVNEKFNVLPPKIVLRDLINHGIPFSIAIKAIQAAARRSGASAFWKATLTWTAK